MLTQDTLPGVGLWYQFMIQFFGVFAIYLVGSLVLTIAFLVAWARNFAETRQFMHAGLAVVGTFLITDMFLLWLAGLDAVNRSAASAIATETLTAVRLYAYTVVGLLLSQRLNDAFAESGQPTAYGLTRPTGKTLSYALLATTFMAVFSIVLFVLTKPTIGAFFQSPEALSTEVSFAVLIAVSVVAFAEEITFRLGLQNGLTYLARGSRYGHHWAVVLTTAFWTVAHVGSLDPNWVKYVQVFAFGLVLGHMNRRLGIVPCIVTHVLFNMLMVFVSAELIRYGVISVGATP